MFKVRVCLIFFLVWLCLFSIQNPITIKAQQSGPRKLILIYGGGNSSLNEKIVEITVKNTQNRPSKLLLLPITSDPNQGLFKAEEIRQSIQNECQKIQPPGFPCMVTIVPIFSRAEAFNPDNINKFSEDVNTIFIPDGDVSTAMQIIGGTPIEYALASAYQRGVLIAGNGAGARMQSLTMLNGYNVGFDTENSLNKNAINIWNTNEKHGLIYGISNAIIDDYIFSDDHFVRLVNAILNPESPHIGIGIDIETGLFISDNATVDRVFGNYSATIIDAETYQAYQTAQFTDISNNVNTINQTDNLISARNILIHLLAPGNYSYNLSQKVQSISYYRNELQREFIDLQLPSGAGPLILSGDLSDPLMQNKGLSTFLQFNQGKKNSRILIITSGFLSQNDALTVIDQYRNFFKLPTENIFLPSDSTLPIKNPADFSGILFIGSDQSPIPLDRITSIKNAWLSGKSVMAIGQASSILGNFFIKNTSPYTEMENKSNNFLKSTLTPTQGLGLLNAVIVPDTIDKNQWSNLFSLTYSNPSSIGIGLNTNSAIEITNMGAQVLGKNCIFILDLRQADLAVGDNNAFVIANGLMDIYSPGETILPLSVKSDKSWQPTPILTVESITTPNQPKTTPTPSPAAFRITETSQILDKHKTPRPSPTPLLIPPPADEKTNRSIIGFGILSIIVVLFGLWLNRDKLSH